MKLTNVCACLCAVLAAMPSAADKVRDGALSKRDAELLMPFLGDYTGQWNSEVTDNVHDDISRYQLDAPVMRLSLDDARRPRVTFFIDSEAAKAGEPLDLLGFGCRSRVGPALTFDKPAKDAVTVLQVSFDFDWGQCPSRVYAVKSNDLKVDIAVDNEAREYIANVSLLKSIRPDDKVYASTKEGKREVVVRPKEGDRRLYNAAVEYCVVNELGETEKCFDRKSEVKTYLVPFPFPGMTAIWYTKKTPSLSVERLPPKTEYHRADFRRPMD